MLYICFSKGNEAFVKLQKIMKTILLSLISNKNKMVSRLEKVSQEWRNSEIPSFKCDREKSRLETALRGIEIAIFELEQLLEL